MIEIKYWDDSDICGFAYSTGYRNIIRLTAEFLEREYPYIEEGAENGDLEVVKHFQKVVKEYISTPLLVTPQQRAALEKIQLHKYILIEIDNGDSQYVSNFKVETQASVERREHVSVIIRFQTYYEINRSKRVVLLQPCDVDRLANVDYVINTGLDLPGLLPWYEGMRVLNLDAFAHKDIYAYNSSTGQWVRQHEVGIEKFMTNNDDGIEYYFDGNTWRESPSISRVFNEGGDVFSIKGYARRGFVRLEYSEDAGVTWATHGEYTSGQFKAGITVTLPGTYDFIRPVSYTHGCLVTTGAAEANPNSGDFISFSGLPLAAFTTDVGLPSSSDSIDITEGVDATTDVEITAPANFEISDDDVVWVTSLTITAGYVAQTIYVHSTGESSGTFTGVVTVEVDSKTYNVAVSALVDCDLEWLETWIEDVNGEDAGPLYEDLELLDTNKENIRLAIVAQGVAVDPSDPLSDYDDKIAAIGGGFSYEAETDALWLRITNLGSTWKDAYNDLILILKGSGIWTTLDVLHVLGTGDATDALLNIVKNSSNATLVNAPSFTAKAGFMTNGVNNYIKTNYRYPADFVNRTNDAGFFMYHISEYGATGYNVTGVGEGGSRFSMYVMGAVGDDAIAYMNSAGGAVGCFSGVGTYLVNRIDNASITTYHCEKDSAVGSVAMTGNFDFWLGALNNASSIFGEGANRYSFFAEGGVLSNSQARLMQAIPEWWFNRISSL